MGHKTREEYKKSCLYYINGWCVFDKIIKKHICDSNCERMKKYDAKH
jgi:hypothetical protein